jgi:photosystem II stability/assembly factor-like uncharacterized protein
MALRTIALVSLLTAACSLAQDATKPTAASTDALDGSLLAGMKARSIGPAAMSGRIGAVASIPGDPTTIWVGAASGGVWKSTDGGVRFEAVFDDQDVTSIGAIAIDPRTPEVVWVGTGEGNPRNSASVGRGIYRTKDGGRSWQKLGLEKTEHIHRIALHPTNPDIAYVAALGSTWGDDEERGVFGTKDGGATWQKLLYVDARTGCCDLAMDPRNPDKLFAGMWDHRRTAWDFHSGGKGSGLHRSLDGGKTWNKLAPHEGMPEGDLGRSSFAISASEPDVVYCLVEAKKNVLLRSDDGGFRFSTRNSSEDIAPRPFYFCDLRVDPRDSNRVYNLHTVIDVSTDGGRTFSTLVGWNEAHPDHHALWIDPMDPRRIVIGNDGGVYTSQDRGHSWRFCSNLPLAQFYHVAVDNDVPYHVYGGLQDNGSWRGPSTVWENGGIRNLHWQEVCFGDGFATLPDPTDSMQGYAMSQGGALIRWDMRTGQQKGIQPPAPDGQKLRFHWNSAIAQDPFDARAIYYGSQFVHASSDRGESWRVISTDLTTNDAEKQKQAQSGGITLDATGAENHCTILTIAPSPVKQGVMWAGTDDGRVQVTQDGGATWTSVEDRIEGLPKNTWCPHIEVSKHKAGSAFVVFDDHRRKNWTPYVFATDDYGQTWRSLATPQIDGYCLVIEQDPVQENLLFLGTEFGLFASIDGGAAWFRFSHGVPACSAMALVVHPRDGDLVVATHGRAMFVIDDIAPLRTMTKDTLSETLKLFAVRDAHQWIRKQTPSERFPGNGEYRGQTLRRGALLQFVVKGDELAHPDEKIERERKAKKAAEEAAKAEAAKNEEKKPEEKKPDEPKAEDKPAETAKTDEPKAEDKKPEEPKDQVTITIRDQTGHVVRTYREPVKLGLNRIFWEFERDGEAWPQRELVTETPEFAPPGRPVLPGEYEAVVRFLGVEQSAKFRVLPDPRVEVPMQARIEKDNLLASALEGTRIYRDALQRYARAKKDIDLVRARLDAEPKPKKGADDPNKPLRDAIDAVQKEVDACDEALFGKKPQQGIALGEGFQHDFFEQMGRINDTPDAPNETERIAVDRAKQKATEAAARIDAFLNGPKKTFVEAIEKSGLAWLQPAK